MKVDTIREHGLTFQNPSSLGMGLTQTASLCCALRSTVIRAKYSRFICVATDDFYADVATGAITPLHSLRERSLVHTSGVQL